MNKLYEPTKLKTLELKNMFFVPPMVTYAADEKGTMNYEQVDHYVSFAQGGFGMITMESQALKNNQIEAGWSLFTNENEKQYKEVVSKVKNYGAKIGVQINNPINSVPANHKDKSGWEFAKCLSDTYLEESIQDFKEMAIRAQALGFDYIELHFAHGYLMDCLFTTLDDDRTFDERAKYLIKTLETILDAVDIPVGVRISTWWENEKGELIDLSDDYVKLLTPFKERLEYVSVTTTGYRKGDFYNFKPTIDFKDKFKGIPVITTSGISKLEDAIKFVDKVDLIGIGSAAFKNKNILYDMCPSREEMNTLNNKFTTMGRMIVPK